MRRNRHTHLEQKINLWIFDAWTDFFFEIFMSSWSLWKYVLPRSSCFLWTVLPGSTFFFWLNLLVGQWQTQYFQTKAELPKKMTFLEGSKEAISTTQVTLTFISFFTIKGLSASFKKSIYSMFPSLSLYRQL